MMLNPTAASDSDNESAKGTAIHQVGCGQQQQNIRSGEPAENYRRLDVHPRAIAPPHAGGFEIFVDAPSQRVIKLVRPSEFQFVGRFANLGRIGCGCGGVRERRGHKSIRHRKRAEPSHH